MPLVAHRGEPMIDPLGIEILSRAPGIGPDNKRSTLSISCQSTKAWSEVATDGDGHTVHPHCTTPFALTRWANMS